MARRITPEAGHFRGMRPVAKCHYAGCKQCQSSWASEPQQQRHDSCPCCVNRVCDIVGCILVVIFALLFVLVLRLLLAVLFEVVLLLVVLFVFASVICILVLRVIVVLEVGLLLHCLSC